MRLVPILTALALSGLFAAWIPGSKRPAAGAGPSAGAALAAPGQDAAEEPAALAGPGAVAILRFEIRGEDGQPMPGRLTFTRDGEAIPDLFSNPKARPLDLAVRKNVVYSLSGKGAITVPPGHYAVHASRGMEWTVASQEVELAEGAEASLVASLSRAIDSTGWISGDFHLHTLTFSGHGDADLEERIISLIGEGVEFAVATDHNHNTDYEPTIDAVGAKGALRAITGNEVSTPIGHFNAFPLEPDRPVPDKGALDANALFRFIRNEQNRFGVTPVIQLNHPRYRRIDYFTLTGLDPVTGESAEPSYSSDFDTMEVLNANACWGYYDADVEHAFTLGPSIHWALQDWFHLLNNGQRVFAVGNSDSHTVHSDFCGYPRNFVQSSTDDPGKIDPAEVARALREGRSFTTTGPFVEFRVNDSPMGSTVAAEQNAVYVHGSFQSAPWVDIRRVRLIVNGGEVASAPLERVLGEDGKLRWKEFGANVRVLRDSWACLLVEGDAPLDPIVSGADRPVLPIAVTNPIWIDADANGIWTSPWDRTLALVAEYDDLRMLRLKGMMRLPATEEALFPLAAARAKRSYATFMAREALSKFPRELRFAGARSAEILKDASLFPDLEKSLHVAGDPYLSIAILRAMKACGSPKTADEVLALVERFGPERVDRYSDELVDLLPGQPIDAWSVIGYFDAPSAGGGLGVEHGPENDPDTAHAHPGKGGVEARWSTPKVSASGYVDLRQIDEKPERYEHAVAYAQTWVNAPEARDFPYALGSDDGCRLWVNGELRYEETSRSSADPLGHVARIPLQAGWNRVLIEVENATGGFGLYFRVLDERVRASDEAR